MAATTELEESVGRYFRRHIVEMEFEEDFASRAELRDWIKRQLDESFSALTSDELFAPPIGRFLRPLLRSELTLAGVMSSQGLRDWRPVPMSEDP